MNTPLPIRAKLIVAALSFLVVFGFGLFFRMGAYSTGEVAFKIACLAFGALLAFGGIFGNAQLQMLWGSGLAFAAALLIVLLCLGAIHGTAMPLAVGSVIAASIGGYLLLLDSDVKVYRTSLKRKTDA